MYVSRISSAIVAILLLSTVSAQKSSSDAVAVSPILEVSDDARLGEASISSHANMRGATLFSETFSNGFAGDNGFGAFTAEDSSPGTDEIWLEGGNGGPTPANFTFGTLTPNFTTSSNGYALFDAFGYNEPTLPDYESVLGTLTTPSLNFEDNSSVILEYQQIFAYCCFSFSPLTVEVSVDNGTNWTVFPGEGSFIPDANVASGNLTTVIDISCVAAGESDVQIRWAYNNAFDDAFGFYSWCVDDILIYEAASENDLEVTQVTNGDVFNLWEYRVTPIQQAPTAGDGGLFVSIIYANRGSMDQNDVVADIEILDEGGSVVFTYQSDAFDIPANGNSLVCPQVSDTMDFFTGYVPDVVGKYTIRATLTADGIVDASPLNNTMEKSIEYTNYTYGHDDETALDIEYRPEVEGSQFERIGFGNIFTVPYSGSTANGAVVRFGPNTDVEFGVEVRLYELDDLTAINPIADAGPGNAGAFYEVEIDDIPASLNSPVETYIEFDSEWDLEPGLFYFLALIQDQEISDFELTCLGQSNTDTDFSTRIVALTGDQESFWFSDAGTPSVRLIMDGEPTGVEEYAVLEGLTLGQNMPNPARDMTTIQYNLERNIPLRFEMMDATGRIVYVKDLGTSAVGQHSIELDLSRFESGVYQYSLASGNNRITKSMVVTK